MDLRIRGGLVVDGTGAPAEARDITVRDGRLVHDDGTEAAQTIDAGGRIVAPGFVDIHTHYDAQIFWDPALTPSTLHGVTTTVSGNCGFTLAPVEAHDQDYLTRMLANVEGIPREAIEAAVPFGWRSTGEMLDHLEGRGVGPNLGFLAGHSTIRRSVMGGRAVGEQASADDVAAMQRLLGEALAGGALGLGTSWQANHTDGDHEPVPSRWATAEEILALCAVVRSSNATTLEIAPPLERGPFPPEIEQLIVSMSTTADRPINWNILSVFEATPELPDQLLAMSERAARDAGACVSALFLPDVFRLVYDFRLGFRLEALPDWGDLFKLPAAERIRALADPALRERLERGAARDPFSPRFARWDDWTIAKTGPTNRALEGRLVGDVARERGRSPFDALLDLVAADELRTGISPPTELDNEVGWRQRAELATSPWTVLGGSDAGAHVAFMCQATYPTRILREFHGRGLLPVEEIVRQLTDVPARYYGLRDRGRLVDGAHADIVVFDLDSVVPGMLEMRQDLPSGGTRVFAEAQGVDYVIVNGGVLVEHGAPTGATPGTVLRSGRDTTAVRNATTLTSRVA